MRRIEVKPADIYEGSLILVNRWHPLSVQSLETKTAIHDDIVLNSEAGQAFLRVYQACGKDVYPASGFRDMRTQVQIYADSLDQNGFEYTSRYVAIPGCSEHQTGLAIDVTDTLREEEDICYSFSADRNKEFCDAMIREGFVIRYPAGKRSITGIGAEPWHFRYTGYPHSEIMAAKGLVLEEYMQLLKMHTEELPLCWKADGKTCYICYYDMRGRSYIEIQDTEQHMISGDNEHGIIVTTWEAEGV